MMPLPRLLRKSKRLLEAINISALYHVYGLLLESDTKLAGLHFGKDSGVATTDVRISRTQPLSAIDPKHWNLQRRITLDPTGKFWSMYQGDTSFLLNYEGLLQFFIARDGKEVRYAGDSEVPEEYFQWNLVHLVLPFLLHLRGIPVFHAGAATTKWGSVLFFGHSGQGKSTLTAAFGKSDCPIVTDDLLVLQEREDGFYSLPSLPWVRLCQESLGALFDIDAATAVVEDGDGKMRIDASTGLLPFATEPSPVSGVYVLNPHQDGKTHRLVSIEPVAPPQAVGILLGRNIMLPILGKTHVADVLEFLSKLVTRVPVWNITISADLGKLPEVVSEILAHEQNQQARVPASRAGKQQ